MITYLYKIVLLQVEAQTKKKAKAPSQPPPAPSPGSQDSRDSYSNSNSGMSGSEHYGSSYPPPGAPGYNNYPPGPPGGPPGGGPPPHTSAPDGHPSHPGNLICVDVTTKGWILLVNDRKISCNYFFFKNSYEEDTK